MKIPATKTDVPSPKSYCTRRASVFVLWRRGKVTNEQHWPAARDVRFYLGKEIKKLISIHEFNDALPRHLPPNPASQDRVGTIISRLEQIGSFLFGLAWSMRR
jgi:hypothetical protein